MALLSDSSSRAGPEPAASWKRAPRKWKSLPHFPTTTRDHPLVSPWLPSGAAGPTEPSVKMLTASRTAGQV
eukprot:3177182-Heterocapsa_arctica.AAC.1